MLMFVTENEKVVKHGFITKKQQLTYPTFTRVNGVNATGRQ